jgi:hypothetical protein
LQNKKGRTVSIRIETNLPLICSAFNISVSKMTHEYSGMTIHEIMETEAAQGNKLAAKFDDDLLSSPDRLIQFIELNNPANKFAILSNMNENDLNNMLPLLENEDMIIGLNFFTQDKLLSMISLLPNDQAANLSLQMFSPEHLMFLMPKEAIDEVLNTKEMRGMKPLETECVCLLPPEILAQMIEATTGEVPDGFKGIDMAGEASYDKEALQAQIKAFGDEEFQDSLFAIPPQNKKFFMTDVVLHEPKVWSLFDAHYFSDIIGARQKKDDIIVASSVIEHDELVKMSGQLPKELLSVVLTQIDTTEFAKILQKDFRDVLRELSFS